MKTRIGKITFSVPQARDVSIQIVFVAISEREVSGVSSLRAWFKRGLYGIRLIISDDHSVLRVARKAVLGRIPW